MRLLEGERRHFSATTTPLKATTAPAMHSQVARVMCSPWRQCVAGSFAAQPAAFLPWPWVSSPHTISRAGAGFDAVCAGWIRFALPPAIGCRPCAKHRGVGHEHASRYDSASS